MYIEDDRGDALDDDKVDEPAGTGEPTEPEAKDSLDPDIGGEETPEEKAEREKAEADAEAKRRIRIPKARFDEAQAKARAREAALHEEINKLKGTQQSSATQTAVSEMKGKIEELQDKYEDLILDGKKDEARRVRRHIEGMRDELLDYQTSTKSDEARRSAISELTYNAQLANLEAAHPALNPDNDAFDEDLIQEVADLMQAFVKSGTDRPAALSKAVRYVMRTAPAPKSSSTPAPRAEDARRRAAEASRQQPPSANKVGADSDKGGDNVGDITRMSQDRFAKLDEDAKARMRGDIL